MQRRYDAGLRATGGHYAGDGVRGLGRGIVIATITGTAMIAITGPLRLQLSALDAILR